MKIHWCTPVCFCIAVSFMCGFVNRRYFQVNKVQSCECLTDENVQEYNAWLAKSPDSLLFRRGSDDYGGSALPNLLQTKLKDVTTPQTVTDDLEFLPAPKTIHWTTVKATGTTIFSAYYEDRPKLASLPSILVLGYQSKAHRSSLLYCLYKYKDGSTECSSPRKSVVLEMDSCDKQKEFNKKKEREYLHVFHVCLLESHDLKDHEIPAYVALSHKPTCQAPSDFIPVFQHRPKHKLDFGICVQTPVFKKGLHEIVSFIEMYKLLGAQHITMYSMSIKESVMADLHQIYNEDTLEIIEWSNHLHEKEPIHYYGEILAIHDCLYRNMFSVKHLAFVDLDEVLVPKRYKDWRRMLLEIDQPYIDSFIFVNSIYMKTAKIEDSIAESLKSLSDCKQNAAVPQYFTHFDRSPCIFNYFSRSKLIVKPELIFDTNIHGVCTRLGNTTHYFIPISSAASHHYRLVPTIECRKNRRTRRYDTIYDDWMLRYSPQLYDATNAVMCSGTNNILNLANAEDNVTQVT